MNKTISYGKQYIDNKDVKAVINSLKREKIGISRSRSVRG